MPKLYQASNVLDAALERLRGHYRNGDRLVLSFSGGKDSGVVLELLIRVAREFDALPIDVVFRDEEVMYPGTFEYAERVASRPEVRFHWLIAGQPIINAFDRFSPYWWVFDPSEKDKWVREPPSCALRIDHQIIEGMTIPERFPVKPGQRLVAVLGLRASEAKTRYFSVLMCDGHMTKHPNAFGVYNSRPIYDWVDSDVWKAIFDFGWDYNTAYNGLRRFGLPVQRLRVAPPSMRQGMETLKAAMCLWPKWFDQVAIRLPGLRTAAHYGRHSLKPIRKVGESWQEVCQRTMDGAPDWFADRVSRIIDGAVKWHGKHSTEPLFETQVCPLCRPITPGCWKGIANVCHTADPWAQQQQIVKEPLEPYLLREGARGWYVDGKQGVIKW